MSVQSRWMKEVLAASTEATPNLPWQRGTRALLRSMQRDATLVDVTQTQLQA